MKHKLDQPFLEKKRAARLSMVASDKKITTVAGLAARVRLIEAVLGLGSVPAAAPGPETKTPTRKG